MLIGNEHVMTLPAQLAFHFQSLVKGKINGEKTLHDFSHVHSWKE